MQCVHSLNVLIGVSVQWHQLRVVHQILVDRFSPLHRGSNLMDFKVVVGPDHWLVAVIRRRTSSVCSSESCLVSQVSLVFCLPPVQRWRAFIKSDQPSFFVFMKFHFLKALDLLRVQESCRPWIHALRSRLLPENQMFTEYATMAKAVAGQVEILQCVPADHLLGIPPSRSEQICNV